MSKLCQSLVFFVTSSFSSYKKWVFLRRTSFALGRDKLGFDFLNIFLMQSCLVFFVIIVSGKISSKFCFLDSQEVFEVSHTSDEITHMGITFYLLLLSPWNFRKKFFYICSLIIYQKKLIPLSVSMLKKLIKFLSSRILKIGYFGHSLPYEFFFLCRTSFWLKLW